MTKKENEPELWLLSEFCEENYFTTYQQWVKWYEDGQEMAMCVLFDIGGDLYIDQKAWEIWMEESLMQDGYEIDKAKELIKGWYEPSTPMG